MKKTTGWRLNLNAGGFAFIEACDYKFRSSIKLHPNKRRIYTKATRNMIKRDARKEIKESLTEI